MKKLLFPTLFVVVFLAILAGNLWGEEFCVPSPSTIDLQTALEMAESIIFDKKKIMPVSTLLEGEYGVNGLFIGVPAILGKNGVEKVIEMDLSAAEKEMFKNSTAAVQKTADEVIAMTK